MHRFRARASCPWAQANGPPATIPAPWTMAEKARWNWTAMKAPEDTPDTVVWPKSTWKDGKGSAAGAGCVASSAEAAATAYLVRARGWALAGGDPGLTAKHVGQLVAERERAAATAH